MVTCLCKTLFSLCLADRYAPSHDEKNRIEMTKLLSIEMVLHAEKHLS